MNAEQKQKLNAQLQSLREDYFKIMNGVTLAQRELYEIDFDDPAGAVETLKRFQAWGCGYNLDGVAGGAQVIIDRIENPSSPGGS